MKTYCKNVDIEDISMMELAIRNCFKGKWKRRDIRNLLSRHCEYTPGKILKLLKTGNKHMLDGAVHNLALELNNRLMNRELSLPPTVSGQVQRSVHRRCEGADGVYAERIAEEL